MCHRPGHSFVGMRAVLAAGYIMLLLTEADSYNGRAAPSAVGHNAAVDRADLTRLRQSAPCVTQHMQVASWMLMNGKELKICWSSGGSSADSPCTVAPLCLQT